MERGAMEQVEGSLEAMGCSAHPPTPMTSMGVSTTAMDVADAVVTCLVMDEIFAKVCPSLDLLPVPLPFFRVCMSY